MSNTLYTSDLHLGHRMVAGTRGFDDAAEHDAYLAAEWDKAVRKNDIVWVLGDLTLGSVPWACAWIRARPGRKRLVFGNHDAGHPMHADSMRPVLLEAYRSAFEWFGPFASRKIAGETVLLSHFPYTADHTREARFNQWRLPDAGLPLLHGHLHTTHKVTAPGQVHVGVDAWDGAPVFESVVAHLLWP